MAEGAVLDTGFLISLVDKSRACHDAAKAYYKYFLENAISMLLPTVVVAEFAVKQNPHDLPLRNFQVLPFNFADAIRCAELKAGYYRARLQEGQRDAVKDDFKIIAQSDVQKARVLLTEDESSLFVYCKQLREEGKIHFRAINLRTGFDIAQVNKDGQSELPLNP